MSDLHSNSRRSRLETTLKNFLTRERSPNPDDASTKPEPRRGVRRLSLKKSSKDMPVQGTKPASRIPSRPISSTTARTSTTITPANRPLNDSSLGKTSNISSSKGSGTKKKLQSLFNGLGRRSSRSRSRSRPNTPEPSTTNVPPLPLQPDDHPPKLPKLFNSARQSLDFNHPSQTPSAVSSSSIRKPLAVRRIPKPESPPDPLPAKHPPQPPPGSELSVQLPSSSKKTTTAASNEASPPTIRSKGLHVPKFSSMDAGYRFHTRKMTVVDEESLRPNGSTADLDKSTTRSREPDHRSKMSTATRDTRHGSFDFERPGGWGSTALQRTGSNGTSSTHGSSRPTESTVQQGRESSVFGGAGLAGVGTMQRDKSIKRHKDTEEQIKARQRAERLHEYVTQKEKSPPLPTTNGSSNHSENLNASTSTSGTAGKIGGKRVVLNNGSRTTGVPTRLMGTPQHSLFPFEPPVPSPTWSTASNGTAVERKVEKKGSSKLSEEVTVSERKKGLLPPTASPSSIPTRKKGDRPAIPVPVMNGHRTSSRGRSLDLGIGLAWAPSQIKETALLPSSSLFARSTSSSSGPRSVARTASNSTNGTELVNGRVKRQVHAQAEPPPVAVAVEGERTKMGREVADLFRNVLDDRRYNAFKSYVRRFDAQDIPFDGRNGIVERVERLLRDTPSIPENERRAIMEKFIRIILQNA